jgi:hypothetical protein
MRYSLLRMLIAAILVFEAAIESGASQFELRLWWEG